MSMRVCSSSIHVMRLRLRMPFRYGIATVMELPHMLVRLELEIDGKRAIGVAADHLAPKWFTKDPSTSIEADQAEMLAVIQAARGFAEQAGAVATVFDLWQKVYAQQQDWSRDRTNCPPLLWNFGVTFIERCAIDAFCRATGQTLAQAVRHDVLGIRLGDIHPELSGTRPADFLPEIPLRRLIIRHTVGLGDPLTDADIPAAERLDDGLPQSLESCVRTYGLTHFKLKLSGDPDRDARRVREIGALLPQAKLFTLDGNENYRDVDSLRKFWEQAPRDRVLFVEQPLRRGIVQNFSDWSDRPPMIIDESDDQLDSSAQALGAGYCGVSYKSCKGAFKGIANACLMKRRGKLLSAEDLTTVGPVSLHEDLAVVATLGIPHVERNGHHYLRGLSQFPRALQEQVLAVHPDLYHDLGFASLNIRNGGIDIGSIVDAPFGLNIEFDPRSI